MAIGEGHADGERPDIGEMLAAAYGEMLAIDSRLERAIDGIQKIIAMGLNMEADQVRSQQPIEQLALPRADPKRLRIRPRDMPKDSDPGVRPPFLDHLRQQRKVVILDQYNRILLALDFIE